MRRIEVRSILYCLLSTLAGMNAREVRRGCEQVHPELDSGISPSLPAGMNKTIETGVKAAVRAEDSERTLRYHMVEP